MKNKFARAGIRVRVTLLVFAAALPLFILAVYHAEEDRREAVAQARGEMLLLARSQAALQAGAINQTRYVLAGFAANMTFDPSDPECGVALKRIVAASPIHASAGIADRHGHVRCAVEPLPRPINVADRSYFRHAVAGNEFAVSGLIDGRVSGAHRIAAAHPVVDDHGQVIAVLLVALDTARLSDSLKAAPSANGAVVMLADSEGRQIARFPEIPEFRGKVLPAFAERSQDIARSGDGFLDFIGRDGVSRIAAYAKLPNTPGHPLYVVAGVARAEIERAPRHELVEDLAILLAVLAATLGIALFGARQLIVVPLRRLGDAARRYDEGELAARSGLDHQAGEIGSLAGTLDRLAEHNQRNTRALKALSAGNRTLLREKDEITLLGAMCRVAVEHAGYRLALVNYAQRDEARSVRTMASAGHDEGFVDSLQLTWADTERGRGSVGIAIRTGKTCVVHSLADDARFTPWRAAALARGFGSIASFPLHVDGEVIGTFSIIAAEEDAFDKAELELLDEMAADLSFGIGVLRSTHRRVTAEEIAQRATTHDPLTGLPGRIPFLRAVEEAVRGATERREALAVLVVNLPALNDLHDSLGHDPASVAVVESASKLKFGMSPATQLARLAADEFGLLVPRGDAMGVDELARRLGALFQGPVSLGNLSVEVRIAVGATLYPAHGDSAEMLVRRASIAAREAARRELPVYLYQGATERENPERLALASELRRAIDDRELVLHYQSKVALESGAVLGAEALVRWPHPGKGMIAPMQFVPIAEHTGLIRPLTSMVIESAVRQLHAWLDRPVQIPVAVNLSPRNLHEPRLLEQIELVLAAWKVPAALLEFEITESALAEDPEGARRALGRLRQLGCKLYIDDFGTGYSSLSYLVSLPVHAVKIDRSFVRQMAKSREARAVVASVILMARELGMQTVAEGVETREDADLLRELGCNEGQGYFFARPVAADQFNPGR